ncbi:MAG: hypothetical protein IKA79_02440 [Lentisphaeria bacterium]|nr:hypothetical protein [Lentisphaeria bacterium]
MKVFNCNYCGFFHEWYEGDEPFTEETKYHEGFSGKHKILLAKASLSPCRMRCPVCSQMGYFSIQGATVTNQIIIKKMCFPVKKVNIFYFLMTKEKFR